MRGRKVAVVAVLVALVTIAVACGSRSDETLTIYSGRSEELVAQLIDGFRQQTGIAVEVRYGDSAELAATILTEGDNSPADVFFAQDPASLGVVALDGLFAELDEGVTGLVPGRFSADDGSWVGVSGRARVVVYDTTVIDPASLPTTENGFTAPEWHGEVAIAPTNGSFLAFVAAKILLDGEVATLDWLEAMAEAPTYPKNSVIVAAVDDGEVAAGLVNHYYLFRRIDELGGVVAANHFLSGSSAGSLVMPAGAGILKTSDSTDDAEDFIRFLLSTESQRYFTDTTFEYPLRRDVPANPALPALESLSTPSIDLSQLATTLDLATDLVAEAGLL